jgi:hypothetical protein
MSAESSFPASAEMASKGEVTTASARNKRAVFLISFMVSANLSV